MCEKVKSFFLNRTKIEVAIPMFALRLLQIFMVVPEEHEPRKHGRDLSPPQRFPVFKGSWREREGNELM